MQIFVKVRHQPLLPPQQAEHGVAAARGSRRRRLGQRSASAPSVTGREGQAGAQAVLSVAASGAWTLCRPSASLVDVWWFGGVDAGGAQSGAAAAAAPLAKSRRPTEAAATAPLGSPCCSRSPLGGSCVFETVVLW